MVRPLSLSQAKKLQHGQTLYHRKHINADGTAQRWRVSGRPKTWKTMPHRVEVPVKHGMYDNDRLSESDLYLVSLREPARKVKRRSPARRSPKSRSAPRRRPRNQTQDLFKLIFG